MNLKNKIEWLDGGATFNPITGCYGPNGKTCQYCYAKKIAERFGGIHKPFEDIIDLKNPLYRNGRKTPFPYGFQPTFHRYRLDEPQKIKKRQNIFVCSMADLFHDSIPDSWIRMVFEACEKAPQHRYLFLTKNPKRYTVDNIYNKMPSSNNFWFGTSCTTQNDEYYFNYRSCNTFLSIEPIHGNFDKYKQISVQWVIIGAKTGSRKGKVIPKREWIENIVSECREQNVPVFLKNSLSEIWGEPLIQEYPWKEGK